MKYLILLCVAVSYNVLAWSQQSAHEINRNLGRGVNFGNMFEAPSETAWGNQWQTDYPKKVKDLGFNHVRIPIRWEPSGRSLNVAPYTINVDFLSRIKQVVDSCLNNDLYAIIDMHHHEALYENPDAQKERFLAMWEQVAYFFKDYPEQLLFEILNEPHGNLSADKWNLFLQDALDVIRVNNATRKVLIGTAEYGGLGGLSKLVIPNDTNLILTVHYYNPHHFTHQGASWSDGADAWLGTKWLDTEDERKVVQMQFRPLLQLAEEKNIPVHIGEFGAYSKADMASRVRWTRYIARYIESLNFSWAYWEFSAGFGIYNPANNTYYTELLNALLHDELPEASNYQVVSSNSWYFSNSQEGWQLSVFDEAKASLSLSEGALKVNVEKLGTQPWHVQLNYFGLSLEENAKYRLEFKLKTTEAANAGVYIGNTGEDWKAYSGYQHVSTEQEFQTYSYLFTPEESDNKAKFTFDLGKAVGAYFFDEISLEQLKWVETSVSSTFSDKVNVYQSGNSMHIDNSIGLHSLAVFNMYGQKVGTHRLNPGLNIIETAYLSSGCQILHFQSPNTNFSKKVLWMD